MLDMLFDKNLSKEIENKNQWKIKKKWGSKKKFNLKVNEKIRSYDSIQCLINK